MLVAYLDFVPEVKSHEFKICRGKDLCLVCRSNHTGGENHGFKICSEEDLCLVCRGSHGSADLAGSHLDGDPRQQLIQQDNARWSRALLGSSPMLFYLQECRHAQAVNVAAGPTDVCHF